MLRTEIAPAIPESTSDLTPEWLHHAVAPHFGSAAVESVTHEDGSSGRGFSTNVLRVRVRWADAELDAPTSFIVKLARPEIAQSSDYLAALDNERRFYASEGETFPVRIPRCYFAGTDWASRRFCLVLEDLASMQAPDPMVGLTASQATSAVVALARIHTHEATAAELPPRRTYPAERLMRRLEKGWGLLADFCDDGPLGRLPDAGSFGSALEEGIATLAREPAVLVHGDYKVDNLLLTGTEPDGVAVLDWQGVGHGSGIGELARFLPRSLADGSSPRPFLVAYANALERFGAAPPVLLNARYRSGLLLSLAEHIVSLPSLSQGAWSGGDPATRARMAAYTRHVLGRKIEAVLATW